jgi:hypothetical protein
MWRNPTQNLVFSASLLVYLEAERLVTLEEFQDMIGGMFWCLPSRPLCGKRL